MSGILSRIPLLRRNARQILDAAVRSADPRACVRSALTYLKDERGEYLYVAGQRIDLESIGNIWMLGAGKAACAMAWGVLDVLGNRVTGGLLVTKDGHAEQLPRTTVFEASHPYPDQRGVEGADALLRLAESTGEGDLVLCLLSGGGSALLPATAGDVSLSDLQTVTAALQRAGAGIQPLNIVRKHLSSVSGGRLLQALYPARVITLAMSDVVSSDLSVIASGPTVPDPTTFADALDVLKLYNIRTPKRVTNHFRLGMRGAIPETPKPSNPIFERSVTEIVGQNLKALMGASSEARRMGYNTLVLTDRMEGEAREIAQLIAGLAWGIRQDSIPLRPPAAILLGGETTVTVRGNGTGGRNQELALAAAIRLEGCENAVLASFGTDGTDGPTDAAGGIVDGRTAARARRYGWDPGDSLRRNDAYNLLTATGDLIRTGPTGTNVNDIVLVMVE